MRLEALGYFQIPTPPDLFRWWPLRCIAAVAFTWPAMNAALDQGHAERIEAGTDWPRGVMGSAASRFDEFSLPHEAFRYWASWIWAQQEAQQ